ncbi:MAG: hypothetical protein BWY47_00441 [Bacteroidetes bacterium ADurb.Bin302]|jgi:hypothetical protein|nr:MAG: hypothetical protein BWY47_00441 [Bacteroidetes bacterium ADurb.Bin302]
MRKIDVVREYVYKLILAVLIVVLIFDVFCGKRVVEISINPSVAMASLDSEEAGASSEGVSGENNQPVVDLKPSASSPDIEMLIREAFPEEPDKAVKIARCESQLSADRIGDNHLTFQHNGEMLGHSIGLFQIRTGGNEGGKVWSRPAKLGISVEQFVSDMLDPHKNISYARDIYDRVGWSAWTCAALIR